MNVFIERTKEEKTLSFSGTAQALLESLGINPETVLVLKNEVLVTEDEQLEDNDEIKILTVISGG